MGNRIPADLEARLNTIQETFIEKRRFEPAIEDLHKLSDEHGETDIIRYYLGVCYSNINKHQRAVDYLRSIPAGSAELNITQQIQVQMILGLACTQTGDFATAEKAFKEAIRMNSHSSMAYSALGYVYFLMKKYDFAILNFKKAIEEDPNNASAHNNLGYTYADIGVNVAEAVKECRKAVALNPDSPAYRDSLGWAYYASAMYGEAQKELKLALDMLNGHDDTIAGHLNTVIQKMERNSAKAKRK